MSKNYVELKVSDLREECKKRSLEATGLKVHLVERLTKYDKDIAIIENGKLTEKKILNQKSDLNSETDNGAVVDTVSAKTSIAVPMNDLPVNDEVKVKIPNLFERASSEPDGWESRTDVHLDFYNSDLHLVVDPTGFTAEPLHENGFENMFGGVKATYGIRSGKVYFEVKILKILDKRIEIDFGESNLLKVGWSANNSSLSLGEEPLSFSFDNLGKKSTNNICSDYGISSKEGDIIGCFLEFIDNLFMIRYFVNGEDQGEAFSSNIEELNSQFLLPHISTRNINFEVNFGSRNSLFPPKSENSVDLTWNMIGNNNVTELMRACYPPKSKSECEVLMMCGLPSCGKTTWVDKITKKNVEKCYNVLSTNVILDKMKVMGLRKKCAGSRWDSFIQSAIQCLNKIMEIAVTRRRNFILDQTNVYPTAQRRRMKTFEEFIRKAIIIVPTDDEYQRRMNQVVTEEGKDVPESAVLQMKENFVIPEENSDLFKEIVFIELQRSDAEELVKKYNEESKAKKNVEKEEHTSKRPEREETGSYGRWNDSPKRNDAETSGPPVSKKSRWNEDHSDEKSTKSSRDYGSKSSSSSHATKKNDYKGGFCFAREADDTDKGSRSSYRSEDKYESKDRSRSKDERSDKYSSSRSGGGDRADKESRRGRDRDRSDERRDRSRERTTDQKGGYGQNKERSNRGAYNDRRATSSYGSGDSRGRSSQAADYGSGRSSRFGSSTASTFEPQEPRMSRFQTGQALDRDDGRISGRGSAAEGRGGRGGFSGVVGSVPQQRYSEFNPYDASPLPSSGSKFQDYDYKSASGYDSQDNRPKTGFGVPKQPLIGGQARTVGGRWGGPIDVNAPSAISGGGYKDERQSYGQNDDIEDPGNYYADYFDAKSNSGQAPGVHTHGGYGGIGMNPADTTANRFNTQVPTYEQKSAARFPPTKPEIGPPKFTNPYDNLQMTSMKDQTSKLSNPYEGKVAGSGSRFANKEEESTRFSNPYDMAYKEAPKFTNPYDSKTAGVQQSLGYQAADDQAKFSNPYDAKIANYQQGAYSTNNPSNAKYTNVYNNKSGPSTGSFNAPIQSGQAMATDDYADYQSYDSTNANQDNDYDNYYSSEGYETGTNTAATQLTGQFKSPSTGSFKAPATAGYNMAPSRGSFAAPIKTPYNHQSTSAYNTPPNAAYNAQSGAGYNVPPSAGYNAPSGAGYSTQSGAGYNVPPNTGYNAQSGGGYSTQSGGTSNVQSSGAYNTQTSGPHTQSTSSHSAQSSGAYNSYSGGGYNTPSAGGYNTSSSGGYKGQTTGAYNTAATGATSSGTYNAQTGTGYKAPASGQYSTVPAGTPSSGTYNVQTGGGYKSPASGAYNTGSTGPNPNVPVVGGYKASPTGAYNAVATNSSTPVTPYNAPTSGAYNIQSAGAYNAAPGAPYNVAGGNYGAQSSGSYNSYQSGGYGLSKTGGGSSGRTSASYTSQSTGVPYGSYTNTSSGAYGNQSSGTNQINTKSSSSDSYGNPVSAGSFSNPYSNCYENPSGNSANAGYDYYGQKSAKTGPGHDFSKPPTDKVAPSNIGGQNNTGGNTEASGYEDYSQYYGQY